MSKAKRHPLASKIKQIMQADEDVGKIAKATPLMIARVVELFVRQLVTKSEAIANERGASTLTPSHIKAYVNSEQTMDFLQDTVAQYPDLGNEEPKSPKPKKPRASAPSSADAPSSTKGRGQSRRSSAGAEGSTPAGSGRGRGRGKRKAGVKDELDLGGQPPASIQHTAGAPAEPSIASASGHRLAGPTSTFSAAPSQPGLAVKAEAVMPAREASQPHSHAAAPVPSASPLAAKAALQQPMLLAAPGGSMAALPPALPAALAAATHAPGGAAEDDDYDADD